MRTILFLKSNDRENKDISINKTRGTKEWYLCAIQWPISMRLSVLALKLCLVDWCWLLAHLTIYTSICYNTESRLAIDFHFAPMRNKIVHHKRLSVLWKLLYSNRVYWWYLSPLCSIFCMDIFKRLVSEDHLLWRWKIFRCNIMVRFLIVFSILLC